VCSSDLIEGILGNLIDNALRCGRSLSGQDSVVTVVLGEQDGAVLLSVVDNGAGLTLEQRRHLMQRGVRGIASDRLGQGAGLGLAIVAKFAQVMNATFELGDVPGGPGLRATVIFKALPPAAARG
jgi:two-component system, OmpR family, sensor histidine kinase TctE